MNTATLLGGVLFGGIGIGFFQYGRKQQRIVPLICGLALMGFPYFVSNAVVLFAIGGALIVLPYFVRL